MEQLTFALTLLAALGTAVLAGNFFAFSAFLMKALGGLSAERGIVAMQAILGVIKGPLYLVVFFGTAVLCVSLLGVTLLNWGTPGAFGRLAGSVLFLAGAFLVTMMLNVPLNRTITAARPDAREDHALWRRFQASWTLWNHIRMVATLLACACFMLALAETGSPFGRT